MEGQKMTMLFKGADSYINNKKRTTDGNKQQLMVKFLPLGAIQSIQSNLPKRIY